MPESEELFAYLLRFYAFKRLPRFHAGVLMSSSSARTTDVFSAESFLNPLGRRRELWRGESLSAGPRPRNFFPHAALGPGEEEVSIRVTERRQTRLDSDVFGVRWTRKKVEAEKYSRNPRRFLLGISLPADTQQFRMLWVGFICPTWEGGGQRDTAMSLRRLYELERMIMSRVRLGSE